jgi:hypothetical protein
MYASFLTFVTLLDWLRETKHLPSQFDRSWWGTKFSGSGGAQLMAGLRFLGLLNDAEPTERLEHLAFASNEQRPALVADLLRDAYGGDLVAGLARMTPKMLSDRIEALGTTDATHRKAVAFFVNAAKAAHLPVPAGIAKQARNRPAPGTRRQPPKAPVAGVDAPKQPRKDETPPADLSAALPKGVHPALVPFLTDMVALGPSWGELAYRRWKDTFDRVLLYAYPIQEAEEEIGEEPEG